MATKRPKQLGPVKRTALLNMRITPAERDGLHAVAFERGISLSTLLAQALAAYVPGSLSEYAPDQPVEDIAC